MNFVLTIILLSALTLSEVRTEAIITDISDDFRGTRYDAILSVIVSVGDVKVRRYKACYATPLSAHIVLLPCSCIVTRKGKGGTDVVVVPADNVAVLAMNQEIHIPKHEIYDRTLNLNHMIMGHAIELHPSCNYKLTVDLALVSVNKTYDHKPVWLHTVEQLLFRWNMHRVSAASAVSEGCSSYVLRRAGYQPYTYYTWTDVTITFRSWEECSPLMQSKGKREGQYCIRWDFPNSLCRDLVGLPIFCDIAEVQGLVGMIISHNFSEAYRCPDWHDNYAILQSIDEYTDWIREFSAISLSPAYYATIPIRLLEMQRTYPHPDLQLFTEISDKYPFDYYTGPKYQAIISIFNGTNPERQYNFRCLGTIIKFDVALVPCSCIGVLPAGVDAFDHAHSLIAKHPLVAMDPKQLHSYRWTDATTDHMGSDLSHRLHPTKQLYLHSKCDSSFEYDNGLIEVEKPFSKSKIAWVPTFDIPVLKKRLDLLEIADAVRGSCGYPYISRTVFDPYPKVMNVRLVSWSNCIPLVCTIDPDAKKNDKINFDRCTNKVSGSRYCLEAVDPNTVLCNLQSGTPVFCDTHLARGVIGFLPQSWNYCHRDQVRFGVMESIYEAIKEFHTSLMTGPGVIVH